MKIIIEDADFNDFDELAKLARQGKIHTFCMTDEDEEPPRGKWIIHNDYHQNLKYGCNKCGNLTNIPSNYCPNCGKRMKKGGEI